MCECESYDYRPKATTYTLLLFCFRSHLQSSHFARSMNLSPLCDMMCCRPHNIDKTFSIFTVPRIVLHLCKKSHVIFIHSFTCAWATTMTMANDDVYRHRKYSKAYKRYSKISVQAPYSLYVLFNALIIY